MAGFFCFDRTILDALPKRDARVGFIHTELTRVQSEYETAGSQLMARYGIPLEQLQSLRRTFAPRLHDLKEIHTNRDYAPYPVQRDEAVAEWCATSDIRFVLHEDHVILPPEAVLKDDGTPYTVFTPYSRKWHKVLEAAEVDPLAEAVVDWDGRGAAPFQQAPMPSLDAMGFDPESADPAGWAAFEAHTRGRHPAPLCRSSGHPIGGRNGANEPPPPLRHRFGALPGTARLCPQREMAHRAHLARVLSGDPPSLPPQRPRCLPGQIRPHPLAPR